LLYIGECLGAIHSGLAGAQQVEVGPFRTKTVFTGMHSGRSACHTGRPDAGLCGAHPLGYSQI
jgi:hypothetical protein